MTMTPLGPKQLAKEFGTPGAMSVEPTPEKPHDDGWWGDGCWSRGWDSWYGYAPASWNGWSYGNCWGAGSWQTSSTDWGRHDSGLSETSSQESGEPKPTDKIQRMAGHLASLSEMSTPSEPDSELNALLERAYDSPPPSDGQSGRGSLKSLDSATTLQLGSCSRESLDDVADTLVQNDDRIEKGIELDNGPATKETVQEDSPKQVAESTVQEGPKKQVPETTVQEGPKQVPESAVLQEGEKQVPESAVLQEGPKQVQQSPVQQEGPKQVLQSAVQQEGPKQVLQSAVQQEGPKQVPETTVQQEGPKGLEQVPETTVQQEGPKQVPQSPVQQEGPKQVLQSAVQQEGPKQVPVQQSGADTAAGAAIVKEEAAESDEWRKNKYGEALSPAALYARFYRSGRSLLLRNKSCMFCTKRLGVK